MNFIKAFWPALLLTIAAGVVYTLLGQSTITATALGATALTWIGLGAWAPSRTAAPAEDLDQAALREVIYTIVDRVTGFTDEEVEILNGSLGQIQSLTADAGKSLGKSMHSLNHQVQRQSKLLHELAGISSEQAADASSDKVFSLSQFVDDSHSVIQYFLNLLGDLSMQHDGYVGSLNQLQNGINELRDFTATRTGDGVREVRMKLVGMKALADRQASALGQTKDWGKERDNANAAVARMEETRDRLQGMRDMVAMNVAAFSTQSGKDFDRAVRSLQFEDTVTQLVASASGRLEEVNQLVGTLNRRVEHLKVIDPDSEPLGMLEVVEQIHSDVVEYTDRLRALRPKPVEP